MNCRYARNAAECSEQSRSGKILERMPPLERFFKRKLNSWMPGLARAYRRNRDERTASKPPSATPYGFKFSGPRPISSYEADEIDLFLEYLRRSSACIDVGANVGLYSCLAMSRGKQVLAIEPNAISLRRLYRNLICNDFLNIKVYPVGLSSEPGLRRLYGTGLNASFVPGWAKPRKLVIRWCRSRRWTFWREADLTVCRSPLRSMSKDWSFRCYRGPRGYWR